MKIRVALVTGGDNGEREVSLRSADTFLKHLTPEKYDVIVFDMPRQISDFQKDITSFDILIPVIHGVGGEDGSITKMCEEHNIPYFFTDTESHVLCINKLLCTDRVSQGGFSVPKSIIISHMEEIIDKNIDGKVFIKPVHGGSSVDSGVFSNLVEGKQLIENILHYDQALAQEYVTGREFTVSIDGDFDKDPRILAISEIVTGQEFFDYDAKYSLKNTKESTPAHITTTLQTDINQISLGIYKQCKIKCLGRIDFIYTPETNTLYFLEINTIPGFTETSFFPQAIQYTGLSIGQYLDTKIQELVLPH